MVSSSSSFGLFLSLIQLVLLVAQALIQSPPLFRYCINSSGNYTTGSPYDENLSNLLFSLSSSSNRNGHGFYNSSVGENSDKVYALGLCRGDQPTDNCIRCLSGDAIHALTKECPVQKAAFGWYDGCMLRYSNQPLYGILTSSPSFALVNTQDVSSTLLNEFNQKLKALFERLSSQAAAENDLKYATGTQNTSDASVTIYGLTQCTPDLSAQECTECLSSTIAQIPLCCAGKIGGRVVVPSCVVWYEIRPIVAAPASPPLPPKATPTSPPPPPSGKKKSNASQRKVIITVSIVVPLVVLIIFVWIYL